ncbi:hypothetical protein SAY86_000711 [Trapa natans]|uniref:Uncharacterized protein n=1 Tax=Trapa natans TaxID=22666 RepID=A0AAN7N1Y1_TRANT|nr:hypothetical protein SAY86_000711 [Trapa natans]
MFEADQDDEDGRMLETAKTDEKEEACKTLENLDFDFEGSDLFDFTTGESYGLEWVNEFLNQWMDE